MEYCSSLDLNNWNKSDRGRFRDWSQIKDLIQEVIPKKFEVTYHNFCWHSKLNLSHTLMLPEIKTLYRKGLVPTIAKKWLQNIKSKKTKETLICLPSVFMGGFPKSGSTYVYNILTNHSLIRPGTIKEPHLWKFDFQSRGQPDFDKLAVFAYLANFNMGTKCSMSDPDCLTVDASQSLLWDARHFVNNCDMPRLLRKFVPNAKFVIIMRNPVDRMYSDFHAFSLNYCRKVFPTKALLPYIFDYEMRHEVKRFQKCVKDHSPDYCSHYTLATSPAIHEKCGEIRLSSSLYVMHIRRWLQFFPRDQFLFLRLEDISRDLYSAMKQIWSFVGAPVIPKSEFELIRQSVTRRPASYFPIKDETRVILTKFFHPFNLDLSRLLEDERFLWKD